MRSRMLALKDDSAGLNGTVELHLTYDEETGGFVGPKWLLDEKITEPDYAISAGFSYAVVTAHNGVLHLEVTVKGRQAHAAMPESGADALEAATGVLAALYKERKRLAKQKVEITRHRLGQADGRADFRRVRHQRGAGCGRHCGSTAA